MNRMDTYTVLTQKCASDLGADVGDRLCVIDVNPTTTYIDGVCALGPTRILYWTGVRFWYTYTGAFAYWAKRKGLCDYKPQLATQTGTVGLSGGM